MSHEAEILRLLRRLSRLLAKAGELGWASEVDRCIAAYQRSVAEGRQRVKGMFGGMGSLTDVVLMKDGEPLAESNAELDELLGAVMRAVD